MSSRGVQAGRGSGGGARAAAAVGKVVVIVAVLGMLASVAVPHSKRWMSDQEASGMALDVARSFRLARTLAVETGHNQLVLFSFDHPADENTTGEAGLLGGAGESASIVIVDDGPDGATTHNCRPDVQENRTTVSQKAALRWGTTKAEAQKAPGDTSPATGQLGSSFATPHGEPQWGVLFRPDGTPVAFDEACQQGELGSGNGAIYFTNGRTDHAVVLSALGVPRIHRWHEVKGTWKN